MTARTATRTKQWTLLLVVWATLAGLLLHHTGNAAGVPFFSDADDAMRMVEATDLADGQPWQDNFQHSDNAPFGAPTHWSRLVDAPIALLITVFRPILGSAAAGDWAALLWPVLLLLPLLLLSVAFGRRLAPEAGIAAAIVLPALTSGLLIEFMPGRPDHHNVQILLTGALALATMAGRTDARAAIVAGVLAATSLAVGIETLSVVLMSVVCFSMFFVVDPVAAGTLRRFGAAFGLATAVHFVLATPPARYLEVACDALSYSNLVAAAAIGLALVVASYVGTQLRSRPARLALLAGFGLVAVAIALAASPICLRGPYGQLAPDLAAAIFPTVAEARPLWRLFGSPDVLIIVFAVSFAALALTIWIAAHEHGGRRIDWLVLIGFLAAALVVAVFQMRAGRLAALYPIPAGVWLIGLAKRHWFTRRTFGSLLGVVAAWLAPASLVHYVALELLVDTAPARTAAAKTPPPLACRHRDGYAALAALPPPVSSRP